MTDLVFGQVAEWFQAREIVLPHKTKMYSKVPQNPNVSYSMKWPKYKLNGKDVKETAKNTCLQVPKCLLFSTLIDNLLSGVHIDGIKTYPYGKSIKDTFYQSTNRSLADIILLFFQP